MTHRLRRAIARHVPARRSLRRDRGWHHRPSQSVWQRGKGIGRQGPWWWCDTGDAGHFDVARGKNRSATCRGACDGGKTDHATRAPWATPSAIRFAVVAQQRREGQRTFLRAVNAMLNASRCVCKRAGGCESRPSCPSRKSNESAGRVFCRFLEGSIKGEEAKKYSQKQNNVIELPTLLHPHT
jgi:hypothetical protein